LSLTHYFAVLAEAYRASGDTNGALDAVNEGLALAARTNERFQEANLLRLRGDLLLDLSAENALEAEQWFREAIETAQWQSAKSWELRAAMSLGRLWQQQGRGAEARELIAGVHGWFTEGFGTPDLVAAKALLAELG